MTVAPETILLPLLPSGPDGVRGVSPHGAGPPAGGSWFIVAKNRAFARGQVLSPTFIFSPNTQQLLIIQLDSKKAVSAIVFFCWRVL